MYSIVEEFMIEHFFGAEVDLCYILTDITMILIYIALVMFVVWMFKICSRIIKL